MGVPPSPYFYSCAFWAMKFFCATCLPLIVVMQWVFCCHELMEGEFKTKRNFLWWMVPIIPIVVYIILAVVEFIRDTAAAFKGMEKE